MTEPNQNYPRKPRALQPRTRPTNPSPLQTTFPWLYDQTPPRPAPSTPPTPTPKPTPEPPPLRPAAKAIQLAGLAAVVVLTTFAPAPGASASTADDALSHDTPTAAAGGLLHRLRQRTAARQQALLEFHMECECRLDWINNLRHPRAARRHHNAAPAPSDPREAPHPFRAFLLRLRFPLAKHDRPTLPQHLANRRADRRHNPPDDYCDDCPDETAPLAPPATFRPR